MEKKAIIIGAGPAGLTAAFELLKRTDIKPIILEKSSDIGGISKTVNYKGNRIDIGGHRFFSKSDRVMEWWLNIMPVSHTEEGPFTISYQQKQRAVFPGSMADPSVKNGSADKVMLLRQRLSRIYFLRRFFTYPLQLSLDTLKKLGLRTTFSIIFSYFYARLRPRKPEKNLEDFIINRFGKTLYKLFFSDYTQKVWGIPCEKISAEWGAQRIKGVSISKAIAHALKNIMPAKKQKGQDIMQKGTETSLIESFLYPKYGPGQLWEEVARQIEEMGGTILMDHDVKKIHGSAERITAVEACNRRSGKITLLQGDYFFSTMPVQELVEDLEPHAPDQVRQIAAGLQYRDFITVGILLKKLTDPEKSSLKNKSDELKDTWIYVQEKDVKVGRIQFFHNWSPYLVKDPENSWIGLEYFCNKDDEFWLQTDEQIRKQGIGELEKMGFAHVEDVLDAVVIRMEKTYPAYFGTYSEFDTLRKYMDSFENLFLVGRNGMHKYNNSDHSMLTAMTAVDNIIAGIPSKENIWAINTEQEYHEEKKTVDLPGKMAPPAGFIAFLWKNKWNQVYCIAAFLAWLIQFIIFKIHYPFANYMPDSYSYLEAAYNNADINMWPVAYSKFLRLMSVFTHSDKVLVSLQYFFMQLSAYLFLFTLLYFLKPAKPIRNTLLVFFLLNPLPLYISNYIAADALFISCSLLWFTTLIWIIYSPRRWQIFAQAVLLLACFTIRYNAIYYPLITIAAFILSRQSWKTRIAGITLSLALIACSYLYTSQKMMDLTGTMQFSAFGGWQMANNALYMYEHIPAAQRSSVPTQFAALETMVRQHMDTLKRIKFTYEDTVSSRFYLWSTHGPLVQYMDREYKKDSVTPYFKRWATEGPLFLQYGKYLISRYPWSFIENFMLPNAVKFAVPPTEFLGIYNMGGDSVGQLAKSWFQYKSRKVKDHNDKVTSIPFTEWYPIFAALVNLLLLIHIIGLLVMRGLAFSDKFSQLIFLVAGLWLLNAGFSIFASPITLRYQFFPVLVSFCTALLAGEMIYKSQPSKI